MRSTSLAGIVAMNELLLGWSLSVSVRSQDLDSAQRQTTTRRRVPKNRGGNQATAFACVVISNARDQAPAFNIRPSRKSKPTPGKLAWDAGISADEVACRAISHEDSSV